MTNNLSVVEAAVEYAHLGYTPVPVWGVVNGACQCPRGADCDNAGKHPRGQGWDDYATNDPEAVAQIFGNFPGCNAGLLLGPAGGVIDVEFDDEQGELTAARLLNGGPRTPAYTSARSTHRLYRFRDIGIAKAVAKASGLEVRLGAGGKAAQSVAPPSLHASGERYRWLDGLSIRDVPLAELPQAVVDLLLAAPEPTPVSSSLEFVVADDSDLATAPGVGEGRRNQRLCQLVGAYLATRGADADLVGLALAWGDRCTPPLPHDEVIKVISALATKEQLKQPPPKAVAAGLAYRRYETIESRSVEWVWPGRFPVGKLSLLVGEPGVGKTHLLCDMIAHVTTGRAFPDGTQPLVGECAVLTCEDDPEDTLRPRLEAAGADLAKVFHIDGVKTGGADPAYVSLDLHLPAVEQFLDDHPEVVLFSFDPISAFIGRADGNSNSEVRAILGPLSRLAEQRRVAILGISHLNKSDGKAVNRVVGSIGWIAAARTCWRVGFDPDCEDGETRIFTCVKNNLSKTSGLAYRLVDGHVQWDEREIFVAPDDLDDAPGCPREEVAEWLRSFLQAGPQPAETIQAKARLLGFKDRTLRRAKRDLGVKSRKGEVHWEWGLPEQPPAGPEPILVV